MVYQLIDINNNVFTLPDKFLIPGDDKFSIDIDLIERTFRDGSIFPGISRIKARDISFTYNQYANNNSGFRDFFNEFFMWAFKAVKIRNATLNIETDIKLSSGDLKYDKGSHIRSSDNSLTFKQLNPFWEDVNYTTVNISGTPTKTTGTYVINNTGWAEMPCLITLTASLQATYILFQFIENNQGIYIADSGFGVKANDVYIINNKDGIITLNNFKRNQYIFQGTGFFMCPVGTGSLYYEIDTNCAIKIEYKKRFFI